MEKFDTHNLGPKDINSTKVIMDNAESLANDASIIHLIGTMQISNESSCQPGMMAVSISNVQKVLMLQIISSGKNIAHLQKEVATLTARVAKLEGGEDGPT